MPAVNGHPDNWLRDTLRKLRADLDALTRQQSGGATDKTGTKRVTVGQLPNGDVGILLADVNGATTELLPLYAYSNAGPISCSTALHDLGLPGQTVIVGASGKVKVTLSAQISPTDGGSGTYAGAFLSVSDGGATPAGVLLGMTGFLIPRTVVGVGWFSAASSTVVATGLAPGSHVLTIQGAGQNPNGAIITNLYAQYEPI